MRMLPRRSVPAVLEGVERHFEPYRWLDHASTRLADRLFRSILVERLGLDGFLRDLERVFGHQARIL